MSQERDALVRTYLEKYKDLPTMSLAKLIYKEHPALFSSLEIDVVIKVMNIDKMVKVNTKIYIEKMVKQDLLHLYLNQ